MISRSLLINNHGSSSSGSGIKMGCGEALDFPVQRGFGVGFEESSPGSRKDTVELTSQSDQGPAASGRDRAGTDSSCWRW